MQDNPYIVVLDKEGFSELYETIEREWEDVAGEHDNPEHQLAVKKVIAAIEQADKTHLCVDEGHPLNGVEVVAVARQ